MKHVFSKSNLLSLILSVALLASFSLSHQVVSAKSYPLIVLSCYSTTLNIGDTFYLAAFTSNGNIPTFKTSSSKVATVTSYGEITAKAAGTCKITAKDSSSEVSCKIKVNKTKISLNRKAVSLEHGETFKLTATTSNDSIATFKSNRSSVAVVDDKGNITASKPGDAIITVTADKSVAQCKVTVKQPTVKLNKLYVHMYRCQSVKLNATVSSGIKPTWKSGKTSVATVDETGKVTARKHGTTLITAKVDNISKICEVVVEQPIITLTTNDITLKAGEKATIGMTIDSGNAPVWKSKKKSIASVDQLGNITAKKAGTTTITVTEDGTTESCIVHVTAK